VSTYGGACVFTFQATNQKGGPEKWARLKNIERWHSSLNELLHHASDEAQGG